MVKETASWREITNPSGSQSQRQLPGPSTTAARPASHSRPAAPIHPVEQRNPKSLANSADSVDYIAERLQFLGAPQISREELSRLCKGPFGDALLFVVDHVRGRAETAACCVAIHEMRDSGSVRRNLESDSSFVRAKNAASRLNSAQNEYKIVHDALMNQIRNLSEAQREADHLQAILRERKLTIMLLRVLEERENIRQARLARLGELMVNLMKSGAEQEDKARDDTPPSVALPDLQSGPVRAEYTRDVLTALRAHHIRLCRILSDERSLDSKASETRLRSAVASALDLPEDDDQVTEAFEKCRQSTRRRAAKYLRYNSPLPNAGGEGYTEADLNASRDRLIEKEKALQDLSDHSITLARSCTQSMQVVSAFTETTASALRESLREEAASAEGYIDVLRLSITQRADSEVTRKDADGLSGQGKSWHQTLIEVQDALQQAHEKETFLRHAVISQPRVRSDIDEMIAAHTTAQAEVDDRVTKLLSRKLEKARAGDVLEADITRLTREVAIVSALSGSNG